MHLEVRQSFPPTFGHPNLEVNIFHTAYIVTFHQFLFHFHISCPDQSAIRETRTEIARFLNSIKEHSSSILRVLNLHLEVSELFFLRSGHPNLEINIFHISYTITFYPFLFYFYISCLNQPGMRETRMQLAQVFNSKT